MSGETENEKGLVFLGLSSWQLLSIFFVITLTVLYPRVKAVKYYTKISAFYMISLFSAMFVIIYALPRPRNWRNHLFVKLTAKYIVRPILGLEVFTRNWNYLDEDTAAIVVVNHQSSVDVVPLFSYWPDRTVVLAKKEIWYTGSFGLAAWLCGTVYVDRSNPTKARKTMDETVSRIKKEKLKVIVFPEGTRNHSGSMLPFKKGAFHIAVQSQVPIIPVVISSYQEFYSLTDKRFDAGKVIMEVLPQVPTEGLTVADVTELTEKTRNVMLECFERNSVGVKQPEMAQKSKDS